MTLHVEEEEAQSDFKCRENIETESYADSNTDNSEIENAVLWVALAGIVYGVVKIAPHAKKWWKESAAPGIKNAWNKLTHRDPAPKSLAKDATDEEKLADNDFGELDSGQLPPVDSEDC